MKHILFNQRSHSSSLTVSIKRYYCTNNKNNNTTISKLNNIPSSPLNSILKYTKSKPTKNIIINGHNQIYKSKELIERGYYNKAEKSILYGFRYMQSRVNPLSSIFTIPNHAVGLVSYKMGKFSIGEQFLKYSLDRKDDDTEKSIFFTRHQIGATNDLGLTFLRQGRSQEAEETLFKALDMANKYELFDLLPTIYSNLGEFYKEMCYYDKAAEYHGLAHSQANYNKDLINGADIDISRIYLNRAQILRISGSLEECKVFYEQGVKHMLQYFDKMGYSKNRVPKHNDWAKSLIEFGHIYYQEGQYEKALLKFQNAKTIFEEMGNANTLDALFNQLNIALILKHFNPTQLDSNVQLDNIQQILQRIEKPYQELKREKYMSRFNRIDTVIQSLKEQKFFNSLGENIAAKKNSEKNIKLIEPQHFQLTCFK
ncbi:hypothetical protein DLAC_05559 [Tieghemostelium lacteum]|uniref:Tetratricopeptide repeat protein 29 n=1 Tax=Tieghemostelium lacteum TaxID=361077 RepID=A0A151ZGB7_TIELA|nr:hypothetical protein DLAC_05559 [Tieghemostelium lacteum]|eukprot:KYQ92959.1 hypothetical protein DLAC_05559 [Tieghemostelium lacteum]